MKIRIYIRDQQGNPHCISEGEFKKRTDKRDVISQLNREGVLVGGHTYYPPQSIFKVCFEESS